jgi:osmoprotectant transport system ATP-binding protein
MRALMLDPPFLLLDEPLGALDPLIRAELQRELKGIFARLKKTVLLVTHDLAEAAYFSERISVLHAGRLLQTGSMTDLREQPADPYVAEFVRAEQQSRLAA